jgi:hypothetical protein
MSAPGRRDAEREDRETRDVVDLAGDGSFPASDPPSWWSGRDPGREAASSDAADR